MYLIIMFIFPAFKSIIINFNPIISNSFLGNRIPGTNFRTVFNSTIGRFETFRVTRDLCIPVGNIY